MNKSECASISHSKELAELFPDAEYWWVSHSLSCDPESREVWHITTKEIADHEVGSLPCLSIPMLLEILPMRVFIVKVETGFQVYENICKEYMAQIAYAQQGKPKFGKCFTDKSLANALCLMIKYLRDNRLLKEEKNERK